MKLSSRVLQNKRKTGAVLIYVLYAQCTVRAQSHLHTYSKLSAKYNNRYSLESLNIKGNMIGEEGMALLAESLKEAQ